MYSSEAGKGLIYFSLQKIFAHLTKVSVNASANKLYWLIYLLVRYIIVMVMMVVILMFFKSVHCLVHWLNYTSRIVSHNVKIVTSSRATS